MMDTAPPVAPPHADQDQQLLEQLEQLHVDRVAHLGCVVCRNLHRGYTPACIHHCRDGMGMGQRNDGWHTLPLCRPHHQFAGRGVSIHDGQATWEQLYGTEAALLAQVYQLLRYAIPVTEDDVVALEPILLGGQRP